MHLSWVPSCLCLEIEFAKCTNSSFFSILFVTQNVIIFMSVNLYIVFIMQDYKKDRQTNLWNKLTGKMCAVISHLKKCVQ